MKYFIDTADITKIVEWKDYVEGVTTNPILLRKENTNATSFAVRMSEMFDNIFLQIDKEEDLIDSNSVKGRMIYKVPLIKEKFGLIRKLIDTSGIRVCGTTTYDLIQFHKACDLGCNFCIVLLCKNENRSFLNDCIRIKNIYNYKTEIIAASFREKGDVMWAMLEGVSYATVPPAVLEKCFTNDHALKDYKEYINGK